jgi:hypothetical protein
MLFAIPPDEPDHAQHKNKNHRKHQGVFENIPPVIFATTPEYCCHGASPP